MPTNLSLKCYLLLLRKESQYQGKTPQIHIIPRNFITQYTVHLTDLLKQKGRLMLC